jgi:hypothetical protein
MKALELLAACGTNLDKLLSTLQLPIVSVEHCLCRDISGLRFGERRTVDFRQCLASANPIT